MLDEHIIEAVESYGIPRGEISVERLLGELKGTKSMFRLFDQDESNWGSAFLFYGEWHTMYSPDLLKLLALSYCAICAQEYHDKGNRLNEKQNKS